MSTDPRETFLNGDDAESVLGVPAIGFVPTIKEGGKRLIKNINTFSPVMESYRSLRTQLRFVAEQPLRSLLVTSAVPGEGKSTTCANLAMAMALDGKRVIVVDADLRRPAQHKLFKIKSSPGLTDILTERHSVKDALYQTVIENVSVIPAGSVPTNAAELLGSDAMARLLPELENLCDIVLLDSPPVLAVCDAMLVASQVGSVLVVIARGETKQTHTCETMKLFARARATVVGTVLNRIEGGGNYYYYTYYSPSDEAAGDSSPATSTEINDAAAPAGANRRRRPKPTPSQA